MMSRLRTLAEDVYFHENVGKEGERKGRKCIEIVCQLTPLITDDFKPENFLLCTLKSILHQLMHLCNKHLCYA